MVVNNIQKTSPMFISKSSLKEINQMRKLTEECRATFDRITLDFTPNKLHFFIPPEFNFLTEEVEKIMKLLDSEYEGLSLNFSILKNGIYSPLSDVDSSKFNNLTSSFSKLYGINSKINKLLYSNSYYLEKQINIPVNFLFNINDKYVKNNIHIYININTFQGVIGNVIDSNLTQNLIKGT